MRRIELIDLESHCTEITELPANGSIDGDVMEVGGSRRSSKTWEVGRVRRWWMVSAECRRVSVQPETGERARKGERRRSLTRWINQMGRKEGDGQNSWENSAPGPSSLSVVDS